MDLVKLRKLVALDAKDPLSRFALGQKLAEGQTSAELDEAVAHLQFANQKAPQHLATYHVLAGLLIRLGRNDEARPILEEGIRRATAVGEGMGRDLAPAMREMLQSLGER